MESEKKQEDVHFPDDLVLDILRMLPVKSLARFQCVCKRWRSTLLTQLNQDQLLLCSYFFLQSIDFNAAEINAVTREFPLESQCSFNVIGSSNGLLCFSTGNTLFLWNPWTRRHRTVLACEKFQFNQRNYGFGYDPSADDYLIIRIRVDFFERFAEIYSCKAGSWLQKKRLPRLLNAELSMGSMVSVDAALYWHIDYYCPITNDFDAILCFDLSHRNFSLILPPVTSNPGRKLDRKLDFELVVLGGRLCMVNYDHDCHTDIWAWEGGDWIKWMSIPCSKELQSDEYYMAPVFLMKNGEVLVNIGRCRTERGGGRRRLKHEMKGKGFLLYNREEKTFREWRIRGAQLYCKEMTYTKTLASPAAGGDGGYCSLGCEENGLHHLLAEKDRMLESETSAGGGGECKERVKAEICEHLLSEYGGAAAAAAAAKCN